MSIEIKNQGILARVTESPLRLDHNHKLSLREFPYIIRWRDDRCKRCGKCTAVCPVKAIEPTVKVQRFVQSEGSVPTPAATRKVIQVVEQVEKERSHQKDGEGDLALP